MLSDTRFMMWLLESAQRAPPGRTIGTLKHPLGENRKQCGAGRQMQVAVGEERGGGGEMATEKAKVLLVMLGGTNFKGNAEAKVTGNEQN